jgi:hypothetical protein
MNTMARGPITFLAGAVAGFLVWLATRINDHSLGGYWAVYAIIAGAGVILAASQLVGGRPLPSPSVLLFAFLPALIVVGWIAVAGQPHGSTTRGHVLAWSSDLGIVGTVRDLAEYIGVLAFGLGAILGFSFAPEPVLAEPASADGRDWPTRTIVRPTGPVGAGAVEERAPVGAADGRR